MGSTRTRSTPGRSSCWTERRASSKAAAQHRRTRRARRKSMFCTGRSASGRSKTIFCHESSANEPGGTARSGRARSPGTAGIAAMPAVGGIARSVYRRPAEISEEDCTIIALIDRQYLARPYYGSRRMAAWLATQGHVVNRKRVRRLMRLAGLVAIYQRPNTSKSAPAHKIYPYLLGGISIERVNQVWCSDVTYMMARGFLYLVVIMDWLSRAVLAWRLSNTLGAEFCVEALEEALLLHGRPEIFNTDQGSQFTSDDFTGTLERHGVTISMDDKGRYMDNIFVERLWAQPQIRGGLPQRLCQRRRGQGR